MRRALATAALVLGAALIVPSASTALDAPQAEYRSRVEPICKAEGETKERIMGGSRPGPAGHAGGAVKERGRRLVKASRALGKALAKLRAIPRPEVDGERLVKWLDQIDDQVGRLRRAGKSAIEGDRGRSQKLVTQFTNASPRANNLVVSYEFRHCVIEEAGFTP
jgi:molybdenum-dependent DNA-binding transcriptional regulator ModE